MKVLVTGGLGYIGSHTVVELIKNGYDVVVVDNLDNSKLEVAEKIKQITNKQVKVYVADVKNEDKLSVIFDAEEPEAVIHFAGYKAVGESCAKPLKYYKNNVDSTLSLLSVMEQHNSCKSIVFSSSATVYGVPDSLPFTENSPIKEGASPYAQTKIFIEYILKDWAKANPNKNVALLRYFNPIGAHPSGLLGEDPNGIPNNLMPFIQKVATGILPTLKIFGSDYPTQDGTAVRDYIHVCDLARGHVLTLNKLKSYEGVFVCNLGTGKGTSVLEMVHAFENANNIKINHEFAERRSGDVPAYWAGTDKAKNELGFVCEYSIEDACKHSYEFQKKQNEQNKL